MQNIAIQVKDDYFSNFMSYVNTHSQKITIIKDKNLEVDPYFYERQKELHNIRMDIKSGDMEMLSETQYEEEIEQFFLELEK